MPNWRPPPLPSGPATASMKTETATDGGGDRPAEERIVHGLAVSPGIAIGPAHVRDHCDPAVPEYYIEPEKQEAEHARLAAAVAVSVKQLLKLKTKAQALPEAA